MIIAKQGMPLVIVSWLVLFVFIILTYFFVQPGLVVVTALTAVFCVFNMFFFRDPERNIPEDPKAIISPADGKVVLIEEVEENNFFNQDVLRVSIFLSVFNVHVNRNPIGGVVKYFRYNRGKFLAAFNHNASLENEQTAVGIEHSSGRKVMFTQIAGLIARRIICDLRENDTVDKGARMGLIRYGSRVDVYFKKDEVSLKVNIGDKVSGGESIIGVFH